MSHYAICAEPGQVIAAHAPRFSRRYVVLFVLGLAGLAIEIAATYSHHNEGWINFGGDLYDPRIEWRLWIGTSLVLLGGILSLVASPRWGLFKEEIRFTANEVVYRRGPSWLFRARRYEMSRIRWPYLAFRGRFQFGYGERTISIGTGMTEADAKRIIDAVLQQFPQLAPVWGRLGEPRLVVNPYLSMPR